MTMDGPTGQATYPKRAYPPRERRAAMNEVSRLGGTLEAILAMCDEADKAGRTSIDIAPIRELAPGPCWQVYAWVHRTDPPD